MDFLTDYFNYGNGNVVCGLTSELEIIYIYNFYRKINQNVIVVASSLYEANTIFNKIQAYTNNVLLFPMDDFISSMLKTVSPELKLTRLNTLDKLRDQNYIVVTNLMGYLKYLPSVSEKENSYINITKGSLLVRDELIEKLHEIGYRKESLTTVSGEYSVRGLIVDVYPVNETHPIRVEFDDDIVDNIRYFDENTQISNINIDEIIVKPINENISDNKSSLVDYCKVGNVIFYDYNQIKASYTKLVQEILDYNESHKVNDKYMFDYEDIKPEHLLYINKFKINSTDIEYNSRSFDSFNNDIDLLKENVFKWNKDGYSVHFFIDNNSLLKNLKKDIKNCSFENKRINDGFIIDKHVVICDSDINKQKVKYKYQNNLYGGKKVVNYNELSKGDYVVHISHGIGVYNGLVTLKKAGIKKDYIQILYLGDDKIYVPVDKITNIYKYSDKGGLEPKLNRLNSSAWLKTRAYIKSKVEDISKELMLLYKKRASILTEPYKYHEEEEVFSSSFPYSLTFDQSKSIAQIYDDLSSGHPMDRLLCGDVGFGKTEVALRAAFKAIINNKQVVYLCPTTILSKQQYMVAKKRFSSWPIEIAILNKYTTAKEEKIILERLEKGAIDIVFGTHKLLNDKLKYKRLGLMIIDEEQRFGVKQKEKIKQMKNDINVLTLSATPIPRTLKMALSGLRDLSIIDTAPLNRYPVQTYVIAEDDLIVKDAIYKELARDGQIYILYNNVADMENLASKISKLIPEADVRYAHGQMGKDEIEDIMNAFINHEFQILISTTIIENGIDIPNANTLIVYDADHFGLSQLYQLRGRVGRSDRVAYAYLMYNGHKMLNDIAIKRLSAIREFTELGSGYRIAMRDLSIRGAGDIFGASQAGFVDAVGVSLYTKMLEDAMKKQKGEEVVEEEDEVSLINVETSIDNEYVDDESVKIEIHKLINEIDSFEKFNAVKSEIEDRFGKINDTLEVYMYEEWFEKIAKKLNIKNVIQTDRMIEITLPAELTDNIKGDKLLYESYNICPSFNISYKNKCIKISLFYKNLEEHFIKYVVRLLNTL